MPFKGICWSALSLALVIGCTLSEKQKELGTLDQIVLIIDQCPDQSIIINGGPNNSIRLEDDNDIIYRDKDLVLHGYATNAERPTRDTIVFHVKDQLVEIGHRYKVYKMLSFLFQKGDTVLFTYQDGFPQAHVLNRESNSIQDNYEKIRHDFLLQKRGGYLIEAEGIYDTHAFYRRSDFMAIVAKYRPNKEQIDKMILEDKKNKIDIATLEQKLEIKLLDSLYQNSVLTQQAYHFHKTKSEIELAFLKFDYRKMTEEQLIISEFKKASWPISGGDSLIRYGYYAHILNDVERMTYHVPTIFSINERTPNYLILYDSIRGSQWLSDAEKKVLLTEKIKLIIEYRTSTEIAAYLKKYEADVKSDALIEHVVRKYDHLLPDTITAKYLINTSGFDHQEVYDLTLITNDGRKSEFVDILRKHSGKLIYVDFWASSCLPCIMAIPYTKELTREYESEDFQVVFISLDKEKAKWVGAAKKLEIRHFPDNYIVDFSRGSTMLENFDILEIPRYMIFDQEGNLIQNSAPGPSTEEVLRVLDGYMKSSRESHLIDTKL